MENSVPQQTARLEFFPGLDNGIANPVHETAIFALLRIRTSAIPFPLAVRFVHFPVTGSRHTLITSNLQHFLLFLLR